MAVANPAVVIEVLSPSTEGIDRREKLHASRTVPSIQELVLVWQEEPRVEVHRRTPEGWDIETVEAAGALSLWTLDAEMDLGDVYSV